MAERPGYVELRRRFDSHETSASAALHACRRLAAAGSALNAWVREDATAEEAAAVSDRRIAAGQPRALEGLPLGVKDNLAVAGLEMTCGSKILRGYRPQRDATVVARLRAAGAIVLGMTNMDEFGMGSSTENSAYGPVRNPWGHARVAGGSSGGSAAVVAARMAVAALGSDTGGSIRQPAAFCGVVGLKPTWGRVSRAGLAAFASSLDQIGPLTATVRDAAALLGVIAGPDRDDMTSIDAPVPDYVAACDAPCERLRVGIPREYVEDLSDSPVAAALRDAAARFVEVGGRVGEVDLPHTRFAIPAYYLIATAEASSNLARYDGVRYGARRDPARGLVAMYRATRGEGFGDEVLRRIMLGTFALSAGYQDAYYGRAQQVRRLVRRDFDRAFAAGHDILLTPVTPTAAFTLGEKTEDPLAMYLSDVFTAPASLAGLPALTVPVAVDPDGLPLAVQLIAQPFDEATLFRAGAALESGCTLDMAPDPFVSPGGVA